jgi:hypothetical protein
MSVLFDISNTWFFFHRSLLILQEKVSLNYLKRSSGTLFSAATFYAFAFKNYTQRFFGLLINYRDST